MTFFAIVAICIVVCALAVAGVTECPFCHARGSFKRRHRRADGRPDMRYRDNSIVCMRCGRKEGEQPLSAEQATAIDYWRREGFKAGRAGSENAIPAEIRPKVGTITALSSAWYQGWNIGNREHMWEKGFADGLAGRYRYDGGVNLWRDQAWVEGDAKRKGLHYFPSRDAKVKVKDLADGSGS